MPVPERALHIISEAVAVFVIAPILLYITTIEKLSVEAKRF